MKPQTSFSLLAIIPLSSTVCMLLYFLLVPALQYSDEQEMNSFIFFFWLLFLIDGISRSGVRRHNRNTSILQSHALPHISLRHYTCVCLGCFCTYFRAGRRNFSSRGPRVLKSPWGNSARWYWGMSLQ
jgi:hypothetical protein